MGISLTRFRNKEDRLAEFISTVRLNKYIPTEPTPQQGRYLILNDYPEVFYGGAAGGGKAQPLDTPVYTPFGPRRIGDLTVGDLISNPDGTSARVIIAHPSRVQDSYTVRFHDDTETRCGPDHLWKVWKSRTGKKKNGDRVFGEGSAVLCPTEVLKKSVDAGKRFMIPVTKEVPFTVSYKYDQRPVDPYLLGSILGDGHIQTPGKRGNTGITTGDIDHMRSYLDGIGADYNVSKKTGTDAVSLIFRGDFGLDLRAKLNKLGLGGKKSGDKFIPRAYQYGTIEDRYSLIQGLMDTDGYVDSRGQIYYCTVSPQLSQDICQVLRSLGAVVTVYEKETGFQTAYEHYIKHRKPDRLFTLDRKKERARAGRQDLMFKRIVSITVGEPEPMRCITVSNPNGLYLTNDFIVTHNSLALLIAALQYVHVPGYAALILRKRYKDLSLPGALMDRANQWLRNTDAHWDDKNKTWTFPSGAKLVFGYIATENDKYQYQSAEFQFIGFDELTQFPESQYTYMNSRLRKLKTSDIPLRIRSASNPGGTGHDWVKEKFVNTTEKRGHVYYSPDKDVVFVPATMYDNSYLDLDSYEVSLSKLDHVTRAQLKDGNWDVTFNGNMFKKHWFKVVEDYPHHGTFVRYWDLAGSENPTDKHDQTAGSLVCTYQGMNYIIDIVADRLTPGGVEDLILQTATMDGPRVPIVIEREPGSGGPNTIHNYKTRILKGYTVSGDVKNGALSSKIELARNLSAAAEHGNVCIVRGDWNKDFLKEMVAFPTKGVHDDLVDVATGGYNHLMKSLRTGESVKASAGLQSKPISRTPTMGIRMNNKGLPKGLL